MNKRQRHIIILSSLLIFVLLIFNIINEPFPVKNVNKEEVLKKVNQSDGKMIKVPSDHLGFQWYISKKETAEENLKLFMKDKGWTFVKKESDSFFLKVFKGISSLREMYGKKAIRYFISRKEYKDFLRFSRRLI